MKITFIGAGSLGFTRGLVRDVLTFPLLKDATLCLMDINPERLSLLKIRSENRRYGEISSQSRSHIGPG
jgi:alpha-galactosidase